MFPAKWSEQRVCRNKLGVVGVVGTNQLFNKQLTLHETNSSHLKNGWLEDDRFLLKNSSFIFTDELLVLRRGFCP